MADLFGTPENDTLNGTVDDDLIDLGAGNDVGRGEDGNDSILGGAGDDDLFGGAGDDTIEGGEGNDLITGGSGSDSLLGGDGNDQFYGLTIGDTVDGGEGGEDFDRLFLHDVTPPGGRVELIEDPENPGNPEFGIVNVFDAEDAFVGAIQFRNIEKVDPDLSDPPCFTPGTRIATPKGEVVVESLAVGDRVITRDNGIQEVCWVGHRTLSGAELARAAHLNPVLIHKGALGDALPERDMLVSPNHRVLVASDKTALYFEDREVLVAAKHLTGMPGVDVVEASQTTYIHVMFKRHEVILSDGIWTESFQPGDQAIDGVGNAQRLELLELFPDLATPEGRSAFAPARRTLKAHEARLVMSDT